MRKYFEPRLNILRDNYIDPINNAAGEERSILIKTLWEKYKKGYDKTGIEADSARTPGVGPKPSTAKIVPESTARNDTGAGAVDTSDSRQPAHDDVEKAGVYVKISSDGKAEKINPLPESSGEEKPRPRVTPGKEDVPQRHEKTIKGEIIGD